MTADWLSMSEIPPIVKAVLKRLLQEKEEELARVLPAIGIGTLIIYLCEFVPPDQRHNAMRQLTHRILDGAALGDGNRFWEKW